MEFTLKFTIDEIHAPCQNQGMHQQSLTTVGHQSFHGLLSAVSFVIVVSMIAVSIGTAMPFARPVGGVDLEREILAGSDALLERMVIPPDRPDWVVMDCAGRDGDIEKDLTQFDKIRAALCELKKN